MMARRRVWRERPPPGWARGNTSEQLHARIIDLRAGSGQEHLHCKPRGRAVVVDPRHVRLAPLWNEAILDEDFPRWQDGSAINASEFRRCGAMGYRFDEWLRVLLPPNSTVWRPPPTPALLVHTPGTTGTERRVVGRDEPCVAEARAGVEEGARRTLSLECYCSSIAVWWAGSGPLASISGAVENGDYVASWAPSWSYRRYDAYDHYISETNCIESCRPVALL